MGKESEARKEGHCCHNEICAETTEAHISLAIRLYQSSSPLIFFKPNLPTHFLPFPGRGQSRRVKESAQGTLCDDKMAILDRTGQDQRRGHRVCRPGLVAETGNLRRASAAQVTQSLTDWVPSTTWSFLIAGLILGSRVRSANRQARVLSGRCLRPLVCTSRLESAIDTDPWKCGGGIYKPLYVTHVLADHQKVRTRPMMLCPLPLAPILLVFNISHCASQVLRVPYKKSGQASTASRYVSMGDVE